MQEKVQNIFRVVFKNSNLVVNPSTSAKDIEMWDSLTHIELISSIEEEFKIKFSFNEVLSFNTVGDMMHVITQKLKQN